MRRAARSRILACTFPMLRAHHPRAGTDEFSTGPAPAVVDDKQRPSFETLWAQANSDFLF